MDDMTPANAARSVLSPEETGDSPAPAAIAISEIQRSIRTAHCLAPDDPSYNMVIGGRLVEGIDLSALAEAFRAVIRGHEALHAYYREDRTGQVQMICDPAVQPDVTITRKPSLAAQDRQHWLDSVIDAPFRLETGPCCRVRFLVEESVNGLAPQCHFAVVAHHIAGDFASMELLCERAFTRYEVQRAGEAPPSWQPGQYRRWTERQRQAERAACQSRQEAFWRTSLKGAGGYPELFHDASPDTPIGMAEETDITLPPELTAKVRETAQRLGTGLFPLLTAAYQLFLHRWSGQDRFLIGTPISCRSGAAERDMIGYTLNTLPWQADFTGAPSGADLAQAAQRNLRAMLRNRHLPASRIAAFADEERLRLRHMTTFVPVGERSAFLRHMTGEIIANQRGAAQEINLRWVDHGDVLIGQWRHDPRCFCAATAQRMRAGLRHALTQIVTSPDLPVSALPGDPSDQSVLAARPALKTRPTALAMFEAAVARHPHETAAEDRQHCLTYSELDKQAAVLASHLLAAGCKPGDILALHLPRSTAMAAAMIAIWKAGGTFLCLDPAQPAARKSLLLKGAQATAVIGQGPVAHDMQAFAWIDVNAPAHGGPVPDARSHAELRSGDGAYIIYTSGSTGKPKAVEVTQGNLAHYASGLQDILQPAGTARFATLASPAADLGFTAWFGALLNGHTLHVLDDDLADDPGALADHLERHPIDILKIVPSHLAALMAVPGPARLLPRQWLVLGGEAPGAPLLDQVRDLAPGCRILNHYGPTETTVGCLAAEITAGLEQPAPLGAPFPGVHVSVTNASMAPVPIGVAGELLIGGEGVSAGYFRDPAATAERFVPDPAVPGGRLYRSGDRARLTAGGPLQFLGRIDEQVKIRGFRVEPGETEAWLLRQPGVREAAVVAMPSASGQQLAGFVTPAQADTAGLRAAMASELPDAMVPGHILALDSLPRLANGKIDRKALPDPAIAAAPSAEPLSPLEAQIGALWSETLGVSRIGPEDDFFAIGGDSILALQIIAKARPAGLALTPRTFFEQRTLRAIAASLPQDRPVLPIETPADREPIPPFALARLDDAGVAALKAEGAEDAYPLTPLQEGLLFHSLLEPDSGSYVNQLVLDLEGPFEATHFITAWCSTIAANAAMRTSFRWEGRDAALQLVWPVTPDALRRNRTIDILDWRGLTARDQQVSLQRRLREDRAAGFALDTAPLTRLILIRTGEDRWTLIWTRHHLIVDGWCSLLLLDEVLERYRAILASEPPALTSRRPFRDHVNWLEQQDRETATAYWKDTLAGLDDPGLSITPPGQRDEQSNAPLHITQDIVLDRQATARLTEAAQRHKVTLNTLAQGAWALTLSSYTGRRDVVFGVTSAGRPAGLSGSEAMVGLFINTLPLRVRLSADDGPLSLQQYLSAVQSSSAMMRDHEHMPLAEIGRIAPEAIRFDTILVFQNLPMLESRARQVGPLSLHMRDNVERTHYGLTIEVFPGETLGIAVDAKGWDAQALQRLIETYRATLMAMASDGSTCIDSIVPLGAAEAQLLADSSGNTPSYSLQPGWVERVAANVAAHPERIAVCHAGQSLTYREMWDRSAVLARGLVSAGARPDEPVALLMPRSLDLFCLMIATLRAGCGWMPLDPEHPAARWEKALARAGNPLVVRADGIAFPGSSLTLEELMHKGEASRIPIDRPASGEQLAYILFTSGSTGEPKGAMITRAGMLNNMLAKIDPLGLTADDVIAQTAPSCFDISVWQTLTAPLIGARTQIIPDSVVRDPDSLLATLEQSGTTLFEPVPSLMRALAETSPQETAALPRLRWTLPTGEALSSGDARSWFAAFPHSRMMNAYGPAECADDVAFHAIENAEAITHPVPIGRPTQGAVLRVMNDVLAPVPIGVTGEITVGGVGVGRGYAGDPRTTAAAFLPDPSGPPGARLYRTGDLARWTPGGVLEWAGRRDFQVKIRGHRIETGEIETWLERHDRVARAVAMACDGRLAVWWQPATTAACEDGQKTVTESLKSYLAALLPPYMIPDLWIMLRDWPLNANGKLDRKALPPPTETRVRPDAQPPATPTELRLATHWEELLDASITDRSADFFALGGHSLTAARLVSRLRRDGWNSLPLCAVFDHPVLQALAAFLDETGNNREDGNTPQLHPVPRTAAMPIAPMQHRLWLIDRLGQTGSAYAMAATFEISGELDPAAMQAALNAVAARHEILRTRYPGNDDEDPIAVIAPELWLDIPLHDLTGLPEEEREEQARQLASRHAAEPFDLSAGPLVRAELIRLGAQAWHMPIALHHIIADGWSVSVFARDLAHAYHAARTGSAPDWPPLPVQYADYAAWQHSLLAGPRLLAEQDFWRGYLKDVPSVLPLPTDRPRPATVSTAGHSLQLEVPGDLVRRVERWARERGATPFMALLTLFLILLHEESGSEELVAGTDTAGRPAPELEDLIGFFVNVVPIRSQAGPQDSFNDLLDRVRQTALNIFEHDGLPFERIVETAGIKPDRSRNPMVQHLFVMQNVPSDTLHFDGCTVRQLPAAERHSKFDIALFLEPGRAGEAGSEPMAADWVFAASLYDSSTIQRLHTRWIALMEKAMTDPDQTALGSHRAVHSEAQAMPAGMLASKLKTLGRKARRAPAPPTVRQSFLAPGTATPAVFSPSGPGIDPVRWAGENRATIETRLLTHGAILFRGFDLPGASAFRAFADAMEPGGLYGAYGDLPVHQEAEDLYNSTPYPEQEMILFHNESSHLGQWPRKQWFFSEKVAASGGCTPIVDGRQMLRELPAGLVSQLERRGLLYVRTFTPHLDVSWRDFFRSDDREAVHERCLRDGMTCRWLDSETLQTRLFAPAVIRHPLSGEKVFFNQVQLHHPHCLDAEVRSDLLETAGIDRFPRNVLFGDGEPIPDETMALIGAAYEACAIRFPWQRGDTLMVDNMLTAHARDPFQGERRILVAMAGLVSRTGLERAAEEKIG
ncbi:non-ribosomal peptide synthetase [Novosphingobium beihaiensis]|uniref:Amino acid adenylation domain-containing protein n=1 Tax=Novosphingobium beihaiensis TaxID=2930389 RepID=A0ABT0BTR8_9SPHN|nr:non-ribosomal peptide synthetase [Novosphingobium beihaiensis]MCJ2188283.1 amino acid adenylation domain-containing protein [Novosphingobium beihaiensis]